MPQQDLKAETVSVECQGGIGCRDLYSGIISAPVFFDNFPGMKMKKFGIDNIKNSWYNVKNLKEE